MPTAGSRVEAKAVDNHAYRLYFAMKSYGSAVVNTSESASLVHTPNIVAHLYDSKKSVGIAYLCSQEVRRVVGGIFRRRRHSPQEAHVPVFSGVRPSVAPR